jgi:hypothetical protein
MHATEDKGKLRKIPDCWIQIGQNKIELDNLPELSDSKSASYNDEPVIGRAAPIKTFANGDNRAISISFNLYIQEPKDAEINLRIVRYIQASVYPREGGGAPYFPPPVCQIKCGKLLSNQPLCVVVKDYSFKYPTDVPWDEATLCPYRIEVSLSLETVYSGSSLPGYESILQDVP